MAKRCVIVSSSALTDDSSLATESTAIEIITAEKLQCPANSKRSDCFAGYASFAEILPEFAVANLLPCGFRIERLDNGNGVLSNLCANEAKWHKSCRLFFL